MGYLIIILTMILLMASREVMYRAERRDFLNRLMSKNVGEYKAYTDKTGTGTKRRETPTERAYRLNRGEGI